MQMHRHDHALLLALLAGIPRGSASQESVAAACASPVQQYGSALLQKGYSIAKDEFSVLQPEVSFISSSAHSAEVPEVAAVAPLTENGYAAISRECCLLSFDWYARRVLTEMSMDICDEGCYNGFIPFFSCGRSSLQHFKDAILKKALENCACFKPSGQCPHNGLPWECLQGNTGKYDASAHRRRTCVTTPAPAQACAGYGCQKLGWVKKSGVDSLQEPSDETCCEATCSAYTCKASGFVKKPDTDTLTSPSDETCCIQETCATYVCQTASWVKKAGVDTMTQPSDKKCCVATCANYICQAAGLVKRSGVASEIDPSDVKCCQETCRSYTCQTSDWVKKSDADSATEPSEGKCCEETCAAYTCKAAEWVKKIGVNSITDPSDAKCCQETCASYTCQAAGWVKKGGVENETEVSDAKCCEETCAAYACQNTDWVKKSEVEVETEPSDAKCCEESCAAYTCKNADWVKKSGVSSLGDPSEEKCCELTCAAYTCQNADWVKKSGVASETEVSDTKCCEETCAAYACQNAGWVKKSGANSIRDPSDSTCCQETCASYTCQAANWVKKSGVESETDVSDTKCCGETCAAYACQNAGWVKKSGVDSDISPSDNKCCAAPTTTTIITTTTTTTTATTTTTTTITTVTTSATAATTTTVTQNRLCNWVKQDSKVCSSEISDAPFSEEDAKEQCTNEKAASCLLISCTTVSGGSGGSPTTCKLCDSPTLTDGSTGQTVQMPTRGCFSKVVDIVNTTTLMLITTTSTTMATTTTTTTTSGPCAATTWSDATARCTQALESDTEMMAIWLPVCVQRVCNCTGDLDTCVTILGTTCPDDVRNWAEAKCYEYMNENCAPASQPWQESCVEDVCGSYLAGNSKYEDTVETACDGKEMEDIANDDNDTGNDNNTENDTATSPEGRCIDLHGGIKKHPEDTGLYFENARQYADLIDPAECRKDGVEWPKCLNLFRNHQNGRLQWNYDYFPFFGIQTTLPPNTMGTPDTDRCAYPLDLDQCNALANREELNGGNASVVDDASWPHGCFYVSGDRSLNTGPVKKIYFNTNTADPDCSSSTWRCRNAQEVRIMCCGYRPATVQLAPVPPTSEQDGYEGPPIDTPPLRPEQDLSITVERPPNAVLGKCFNYGDPHSRTFDNKRKVLNIYGYGTFWMVKSPSVWIQGYYVSAMPQMPSWTHTVKVAVGGPFLQGNTLMFEPGPLERLQVWWNDENKTYDSWKPFDEVLGMNGQVIISLGRKTFKITLPDEVVLYVRILKPAGGLYYMNVLIHMKQITGQDGLCGNFNRNPLDDTLEALNQRGFNTTITDSAVKLIPY